MGVATRGPARAAVGALMGVLVFVAAAPAVAQVQVSTTAQLVDAVNNGPPGQTINVAAGTYALPVQLRVKSGTTIIGAGPGQTTITNSPAFSFPPQQWYGDDVNIDFAVPGRYLFDFGRDQQDITLRGMTLTGPQVYGAIHAIVVNNVSLTNIEFRNFLWSGIRGYGGQNWTISNNRFVDAGGVTVNPDGSYAGLTGGSIFYAYLGQSVIDSNRFETSGTRAQPFNVFGIKGRQFVSTRISNNTIRCDFAIELPFDDDRYVDILNNYLDGVVSVPRWAGGSLPPDPNPYSFKIRNNYFTKSYSIEGPHNGMIIQQNVFDFPFDSDYGNLFSTFGGTPAAPGPLDFSNNIVINPGRGVFWSDVVWNNLSFRHNHIFLNERIPSQYPEGLFSFIDATPWFVGSVTDFSTITISDNIVEILGTPRSLIRWPSGRASNISNNLLLNVSDAGILTNPQTGAPRGLLAPLAFAVGVNGEFPVDGAALLQRAGGDPACRADYNADGSLNTDDISDYITDYFTQPALPGPIGYARVYACDGAGSPYNTIGYKVDINGDCAVNTDDISDYITAYFADC